MTPIGSTSSNIRRAIEFIVYSSCFGPGAPCGHSGSLGRLRAAQLIAQRRLTVHLKVAVKTSDAEQRLTRCGGHSWRSHVVTWLERGGMCESGRCWVTGQVPGSGSDYSGGWRAAGSGPVWRVERYVQQAVG